MFESIFMIFFMWLFLWIPRLFISLVSRRKIITRNFSKNVVVLLALSTLSGSRENIYSSLKSLRLPMREYQFTLGVSTVAYLFPLLFCFINPYLILSSLLKEYATLINSESPPTWSFWLGMSDATSLLLAFVLGFIARLLFRHSGFIFFIVAAFLLSGFMSVHFAWLLFLGDIVSSATETVFNYTENDCRRRSYLTLALSLAGIAFTPILQTYFSSGFQFSYEMRWVQFLLMVICFLITDAVVAMAYFHFRFHQQQKLTKV